MLSKLLSLLAFFLSLKLIFSTMKIIGPEELVKQFPKKEIIASYSNFGQIPYGFYTRGRIYYDTKDKVDDYACNSLDDMNLQARPANDDYYPIVMVDRGTCTFVTKVRNVQQIGGQMALIVNNEPGPVENILMMDDGTGSDIVIPSVLISRSDGQKIEDYIMQNKDKEDILEKVRMEVEFELDTSNIVHYDLFFSSSERKVYAFLKEFYPYFKQFGKTVTFTPHYVIHKSSSYDSNNPQPTQNCVSKGLYCATAKSHEKLLNGTNIVLMDLYQLCVYDLSTLAETNKPYLYWDFMEKFSQECFSSTNKDFSLPCAEKVLSGLDFDTKKVDTCILQSFGVKEADSGYCENNNKRLAEELEVKKKYQVKTYPAIFVNNKLLGGVLNAENSFEAICSAFTLKPKACEDFFLYPAVPVESDISWMTVALVIIAIILVNIVIIVICRRYIVKRIHERVETQGLDIDGRINNVVANYLSLQETK